MSTAVSKPQKTNIEPVFSLLARLIAIYEEEEDRLKEQFPEVKLVIKESTPPKLYVVYDFMKLKKEERYRLFEFEERLLNRMESIVKEVFGEQLPFPPFEIKFVRHFDENQGVS